jgi:hypothetical protein
LQKIITGTGRAREIELMAVEAAPTSDKAQVVDAIGLQPVRTES